MIYVVQSKTYVHGPNRSSPFMMFTITNLESHKVIN